jgi:hypothetical protein
LRWRADQIQRINVRRQDRTSDVVRLTFGSETYPTKAGDCVEFDEVSTGAAGNARMKSDRSINFKGRSNIDCGIGKEIDEFWPDSLW